MTENPVQEIKLIAIDIDGTLLTPDGQITPRTHAAIQAAQRAGIIVTLATARRYTTAGLIAAKLGIDLPLITYDGALIAHYPSAAILDSQVLAASVACQAVEIFQHHRVQPIIHPCDCVVEEVWTGPAAHDHLELAEYVTIVQGEDRLRRMTYETLCAGMVNPLRVVAFVAEETMYTLLPALAELDCACYMLKLGSYGCAELTLMCKNCSKASAVATLAEHYHIPLAQVMAIGDNTNDIPMLQRAGWGVAMGQAPIAVKAVARAVTTSNLEDGVALAIERYALTQDACACISLAVEE